MNQSKWTSGPWMVTPTGYRVMRIERAQDGTIINCWIICDTANNKATRTKENAANAKLISKAPELAAILQEIVELVRAEAQVDNGEGLKFLNASAQLVEAERILREAGALEETR